MSASMRERQTAIHEAGHAVAHVRLGLDQEGADIIRNEDAGTLGGAAGEGVNQVWNKEQAEPVVLAFCAGYAALVAAGHEDGAHLGADDDFEQAEYLIEYWGLQGTLADYKAKSVEQMSAPDNIRAVGMVAEHLLEHKKLDGEYIRVLVDMADGEVTEQEFARYLRFRA